MRRARPTVTPFAAARAGTVPTRPFLGEDASVTLIPRHLSADTFFSILLLQYIYTESYFYFYLNVLHFKKKFGFVEIIQIEVSKGQ